MNNNFRPYFCNVNDKPASIMVDLKLVQEAPIRSKPWLLWLWVYMQSPRPDGLSTSEEAPALWKIEDTVLEHACQDDRTLLCGRITTDGRREFYFYGEKSEAFREEVAQAMKLYPAYKWEAGAKSDDRWTHYLDVMYPSRIDLERIKNADLIDVVMRKGDTLTIPRKVLHWICFSSQEARAACRDAAIHAEFAIESEFDHPDGEQPFSLCVARTQSIQQNEIDATVLELLDLAESFNGEYDGWETPIVTQ
jgi:regulator of RNase E activity RraB